MPARSRRKNYLSDRHIQYSLLFHVAAHWLVFLPGVAAFLFFVEVLTGDPREAGTNLLQRHTPTVLALVVLAPLFVFDLIKLSNRFTGPMLRLRRSMRDLADGRQVAPLHFREHDFWREAASDYNRVLQRLYATPNNLQGDVPPDHNYVNDAHQVASSAER